MSIITGRRLNRFWQKGIRPLKDLLGSNDIDDLSDDGTVTGALSKLNTDMTARLKTLEWQPWITPYTSTAVVIGNICIVSLCFEIKSGASGFTDLGVVVVTGVKAAAYSNSVLAIQADGRGIDCLINPDDGHAGYIYINARGLEVPANAVLRGLLIFPVQSD